MRPVPLLVVFSLLAAQKVTESPAVSVCTVLADRLRFNGKVISVRGYEESTDEGSWLKGDCGVHVTTGGHTWPDLIWLSISHTETLHEIPFQTDMAALRRFVDATAKAARTGHRYRLWVTYVGMFETEGEREIGGGKIGPDHGVGFGHLDGAPAQLVIETVRDLKIEYLESDATKGAKP